VQDPFKIFQQKEYEQFITAISTFARFVFGCQQSHFDWTGLQTHLIFPKLFRKSYSPIRSTARGKKWAALCGAFCIEYQNGNVAHFSPRAVLQYNFLW
jgi:hypothetical protein